ncbi:MAG: hypothetical protein WA960_03800 [Tunicatimonas sp.]
MISTTARSQHPQGEKLQNARIALFTERLSLTPEEAERFWPVYNQISEQRTALRREGMRLQRAADGDSLTDAQAQDRIKEYLDLKQREFALEQASTKKLLSVLSAAQVLQLLRAERDFQRMVVRQLGRRRGGRH